MLLSLCRLKNAASKLKLDLLQALWWCLRASGRWRYILSSRMAHLGRLQCPQSTPQSTVRFLNKIAPRNHLLYVQGGTSQGALIRNLDLELVRLRWRTYASWWKSLISPLLSEIVNLANMHGQWFGPLKGWPHVDTLIGAVDGRRKAKSNLTNEWKLVWSTRTSSLD